MPDVKKLTVQQLRNWVRDFPPLIAAEARAELIRRGEKV